MEGKCRKLFSDTKRIDQKSCLMKLCEYVFAFQPTMQMCGENIFPNVSTLNGRTKETGCHWRQLKQFWFVIIILKWPACAQFYNYVRKNNLIMKLKSSLKYDWVKKDWPCIFFIILRVNFIRMLKLHDFLSEYYLYPLFLCFIYLALKRPVSIVLYLSIYNNISDFVHIWM